MPFFERASIFLRAAELVSGLYRSELMATTMLGQGKIDAATEMADSYRFNATSTQEIDDNRPKLDAQGHAE